MSTQTELRAYHGNPAIKEMYVERMKAHVTADALQQKYTYWSPGGSKGCAVGCTLHDRGQEAIGDSVYMYETYETGLGIPRHLAELEEDIFENGTVELSKTFPLAFLEAIPVGADLSGVVVQLAQFVCPEGIDEDYERMEDGEYLAVNDCIEGRPGKIPAVADKLLDLLRAAPVDHSVVMQPLNVVLD